MAGRDNAEEELRLRSYASRDFARAPCYAIDGNYIPPLFFLRLLSRAVVVVVVVRVIARPLAV